MNSNYFEATLEQRAPTVSQDPNLIGRAMHYGRKVGAVLGVALVATTPSLSTEAVPAHADLAITMSCPDDDPTLNPANNPCNNMPDGTTVFINNKDDGSTDKVTTFTTGEIWNEVQSPDGSKVEVKDLVDGTKVTTSTALSGEYTQETVNPDGSKKIVTHTTDGNPDVCSWVKPGGGTQTCQEHDNETSGGSTTTTDDGATTTTTNTSTTVENTTTTTATTGGEENGATTEDARKKLYQDCTKLDSRLKSGNKYHRTTYSVRPELNTNREKFIMRAATLKQVRKACAEVKTKRTATARVMIDGKWATNFFNVLNPKNNNGRQHSVWTKGKTKNHCGERVAGKLVVTSESKYTPRGSTTSQTIKAKTIIKLKPYNLNCKPAK